MLMPLSASRVRRVFARVCGHAAAVCAGHARAAPTPCLCAHQSRPTPLVLIPRRPAAAWPHRRRHKHAAASPAPPPPCARGPCLALPCVASRAGYRAGRRRPPPRASPPLRRQAACHGVRAWPHRPLSVFVPLTKGAHESGLGLVIPLVVLKLQKCVLNQGKMGKI